MFVRKLGMLAPANADAERALSHIEGHVRVEFKRTRGNNRRLALYWAVLASVAPILSDMCEGDALTSSMLHRVLKRRKGLVRKTTMPSGEVAYDDDSISFHMMTEDQRSDYINWAFDTLSKWTKIPVADLTDARNSA